MNDHGFTGTNPTGLGHGIEGKWGRNRECEDAVDQAIANESSFSAPRRKR